MPRRSTARLRLGSTLLLLVVALVAYLVVRAAPSDAPAAAPPPVPAVSLSASPVAPDTPVPGGATALAQLAALDRSSTAVDGYERDAFGSGWRDTDRNGCDTRNDILARDLETPTFKPGTSDCVVLTGTLRDPYTGTMIAFQRGNTTSEAVQIDHIVPLSWSWSHGSVDWSDEERERFANDPTNLRAVDGPTNGAKSDSGPGEWLPPDAAFDCVYVTGFVAVLSSYELSIDDLDAAAAQDVLATC